MLFAAFNSNVPAPSPVVNLYQTNEFTYPTDLAPGIALLELTVEQWQSIVGNPSAWAVDGNALVPYDPCPSLSQQAMSMLSTGIEIISTSDPSLNGTYPVDSITYQQISGIIAGIADGIGLPGGGSTFNWLDTSGVPHQFTVDTFSNFASAVMNFNYQLNTIIGSNSDTLPTLPVNIG